MSMRRVSAAVAFCLLAVLAAGCIDEYAHRHDGSAFETYCFVCQRHAGSPAVVVPAVTTRVLLEAAGSAPALPSGALAPAPVRAECPRGPPLV